jgi:hypothetical protein
MPISKTRKKHSNTKPVVSPVLKSKESRQKIRRWTFRVEVTSPANGTSIFRPPTLTLGSFETARAAATTIQDDVSTLPQFQAMVISRMSGAPILVPSPGPRWEGKTVAMDRIRREYSPSFMAPDPGWNSRFQGWGWSLLTTGDWIET